MRGFNSYELKESEKYNNKYMKMWPDFSTFLKNKFCIEKFKESKVPFSEFSKLEVCNKKFQKKFEKFSS